MRILCSRLFPLTLRPCASRPRRTEVCSSIVEPLETRRLPAELSGSLALLTNVVDRGQPVDALWDVTNSDFDMIFTEFQVSFFVSRDSFVSEDDRFLTTVSLPFGFPGFFTIGTQFTSLSLPDAADTYWGNDTSFQILMQVDALDQVFEFDEFNNVAAAFLSVNSDGGGGGGETEIRLDDLPVTNLPPGIVVTEMLKALDLHLKSMGKDYARIAKAGRGLVDLAPVIDGIKTLRSDVKGLVKAISPLVSGKVSSLPVAGGSLTAAGLELADRGMIDILMNTFSQTAALQSPDKASAELSNRGRKATAATDDDDFLNRIRVDIKKTYIDAGIAAFEKTAEGFKKVAAWVPGVGEIAAGAAVIATSVGRMLKFGAANILEGDAETFRRLGSPENTNLVEAYIGEAANEARERLEPEPEPGHEAERQLLEMYLHAYELSRNLDNSARSIDAQFDELFQRLNGKSGGDHGNGGGDTTFRGKWEGNLYYPSEFGDIGGPMNLTFKRAQSDGTLRGTATLTFSVLDGNVVVDRDVSRGDFTMRQTGANTFRGSVTVTGGGTTATSEFSARLENGLLIGSLDSNAQSTFTIRPR